MITPLPSLDDSFDQPIAKALFDFHDEQEQDLLSFKQVEFAVNVCMIVQFQKLHKFLKLEPSSTSSSSSSPSSTMLFYTPHKKKLRTDVDIKTL